MSTTFTVEPPETSRTHPDRHLACQEALEPAFQQLAEAAEQSGWSGDEVAAALVDLADNHMLARQANADTDEQIRALKND